jgi:2-polyprenyl-3-methyl-5-hydroxy-6-metoxy-1,4-benzoquinol methylase
MTGNNRHPDFAEHADESRRIWDANARWWDDRIGDGNESQELLIEPATEKLLEVSAGDAILDIACGAGRFARRMAGLGASVVAFDGSTKFIERARERTPNDIDVEYHVLDAARVEDLLSLGASRFDKAVCTMALMDMPVIAPLLSALRQLLKPQGRFVFSVTHPCFHSAAIQKFVETGEEEDGRHIVRTGVKVWSYLKPFARKTEGIIGQPEPHFCFHRPLHTLFSACFHEGFVTDGLEEPGFSAPKEESAGVRWHDMPEVPPFLVVRMRLT